MQKIKNGSCLIAHPTMLDETFFKSIILITHHNEEETIGLVLNNPSKIKLHEIINNLPESDFPVYIGGRTDRRGRSLIYNEDAPGPENGPPDGGINHSMDYPGVFENFPTISRISFPAFVCP